MIFGVPSAFRPPAHASPSVTGIAIGRIIDDEKDVSAYPAPAQTRAPFVEADWDLETMEPKSGLYPGQKAPIAVQERDRLLK
jgi:hypothetical protein